MVLFFSGTGNSAYVAELIADQTGDELISIMNRIRDRDHSKITAEKPLVFVTPTYGWRIPKLVEEWITKMKFTGSKKAYFVLTCGEGIGNAEKYIRRLCEKKGFEFMGCQKVVMPENYLALFPVPEEKEAAAIIKKARPVIRRAADAIRLEKPFAGKKQTVLGDIMSGPVNGAFYTFIVRDKKFYATDACVDCGRCTAVCPLHNITLKDQKPVWNGKCTHCMACITGCPVEAIEYGRASIGKRRYQCPEV